MTDDVYIAVAACGCTHGIECESGTKEAAKQIAKWITRGSTIERTTLDEAKERMVFECPHMPKWGRA